MIKYESKTVEVVHASLEVQSLSCDVCSMMVEGSEYRLRRPYRGDAGEGMELTLAQREGWRGFFTYSGESVVSNVDKHMCPACVARIMP